MNSLIAARNFGVEQEYIAVGNGAAELIQALMRNLNGKAGFIRPTFEEYPNRYCKENSVYMDTADKGFSYSVGDIIEFFAHNPVDILTVINPDNPSGNYIDRMELEKLAEWCMRQGLKLVIDESFVDFVDNGNSLEQLTLISNELLDTYKGLYVIKSISKSYGIPGARLGVLASADKAMIKRIRQSISIWNINSFGEFYMQIAEKYRKDYVAAITKIRGVRKEFTKKLEKLPSLRVIPSQANFIMCELLDGVKSDVLAYHLLGNNILIKDLTPKIGNGRQYIRLAVRKKEENDHLVQCLNKYLQSKR